MTKTNEVLRMSLTEDTKHRIRNAIIKTKGLGYKIRSPVLLNKEEKSCCALGAVIVAENLDCKSTLEIAHSLGVEFLNRGFDHEALKIRKCEMLKDNECYNFGIELWKEFGEK